MWNLYDIEKRYEAHMKEVEHRARQAHWYVYAKEDRKALLPSAVVRWVSFIAMILIGVFTVFELF
ncbi:hypothetical protein [Paenibacillus roseipurpureus]|uniref:Uncharacterized protein n=1 Tax=Paenibacillus roseopurpureus TaxID=2918901 RepID=A0AA96LST5_9BACL|nr:hypothetical protein [Paenibacillus sp. MBLB1832]WNR46557.1 hypothetical protein MJB10_10835 [Paenibacillus sp. MBLB1832]